MEVNYISVYHNGIAPSNIKFAKELVKNVDFFMINLSSHIYEIYSKIIKSIKHDLAIQLLKNLKEINCLRFVDWIYQNFNNIFILNLCYIGNKGGVKNNKNIITQYSETAMFIKFALARSKLPRLKATIQNVLLYIIKEFEGFSLEFHRFKRGNSIFEKGIESQLKNKRCDNWIFGLRKDHRIVYGSEEIKKIIQRCELDKKRKILKK